MKKNTNPKFTQDDLLSSCSACECTGLIPAGENISETEFKNYKEIYPFSPAYIKKDSD